MTNEDDDDDYIEYDLLNPIAQAFLEKYPDEEYGRFHHILSDGNLEYYWLQKAVEDTTEGSPAFTMIMGMKLILESLGMDNDESATAI